MHLITIGDPPLRGPLQVVELISTSISDFMEAEFIGVQDTQSNAIPTNNMTMEEWAARNFLAAGSLMAKSCQATLVLAGHSEDMQQKGFEFGKQIAYSWQVGRGTGRWDEAIEGRWWRHYGGGNDVIEGRR